LDAAMLHCGAAPLWCGTPPPIPAMRRKAAPILGLRPIALVLKACGTVLAKSLSSPEEEAGKPERARVADGDDHFDQPFNEG